MEPRSTVALEGFHVVKHALRFAPHLVTRIVVSDPDAARHLVRRLAPDVEQLLVDRAEPGLVTHRTGVEGTADRPGEDRRVLTVRTSPLVLLDAPRHLGNVGAVIRVAAAAGASGVAVTGTVDPWHPTVLRGSAGLHFALPVLHVESDEVSGPFVLLDADGDRDAPLLHHAVLVVGSERAGVSAELRARADAVLSLPMRPGVSSLNLATATAIALYRR